MMFNQAISLIFFAFVALYAGYGLYNVYHSDDEELQQAILHPIAWALAGFILHFSGLLKRYWLHYSLFVATAFCVISYDNDLFWEETTGRVLDLIWEPWLEEYPGSGFTRWYRLYGEDIMEDIRHYIRMTLAYLGICICVVIRYFEWIAVNILGEPPVINMDPLCGLDDAPTPTPPPPEPESPKRYQTAYDRYNNALYWAKITGRECPDRSHFFDARCIHDGKYFS